MVSVRHRMLACALVTSFVAPALWGCGAGPTTAVPATEAPPTEAPPTDAPPTEAPPTVAPTPWLECADVLAGTPKAVPDDEIPSAADYADALTLLKDSGNVTKMKADMKALLINSQDCFPADEGNYGPLMIRLAWHCSGTYRNTDGDGLVLGGCAGGRQRFEPERSWEDNTNLDKARALLVPLKKKWGNQLSWGDLFVLAGTTALEVSGLTPVKMCFGRIDEKTGWKSEKLNEKCREDGRCGYIQNGSTNVSEPHGATTVGLIYVNPEGPMGDPQPNGSVADIRQTFDRMGHSDRATVALIGGGHTLGKCHGACKAGHPAGKSPFDSFADDTGNTKIYQGVCDVNGGVVGVGANTATSGFEGPWTTDPNKWDNEFFVKLIEKEWTVHVGPGGKNQWKIEQPGEGEEHLMRLTSDVALLKDPVYKGIAEEFAKDQEAFNTAFKEAWLKLTTNGAADSRSSAAFCDDGNWPVQMRADDVEAVV